MTKSKIIAVDFDGTLVEDNWPHIGHPNMALIHELIRRQQCENVKLILWTCRIGNRLLDAITICGSLGLTFDAINANLPETIQKYGSESRKICADEYIDDKSVSSYLYGLPYKSNKEYIPINSETMSSTTDFIKAVHSWTFLPYTSGQCNVDNTYTTCIDLEEEDR